MIPTKKMLNAPNMRNITLKTSQFPVVFPVTENIVVQRQNYNSLKGGAQPKVVSIIQSNVLKSYLVHKGGEPLKPVPVIKPNCQKTN